MTIPGGATLWARQTIESKIFADKPAEWFKIWFYLVNKANHKDNKQFKRGTCFMKYDWIREATGASQNQIKHCIEFLKRSQMFATQKATRGFIVSILNYDRYQTLENYKSHTESQRKATQKPHRSHTINKNDKNDKKETIQKSKYLFLGNIDFHKTYNQYLAMRKEIRKPATKRAEELVLEKLHTFDLATAIAMLEQSILNSWQGIFPLKNTYGKETGNVRPQTASQAAQLEADTKSGR